MVTLLTSPGRVARPKETGMQRAARRLAAHVAAAGAAQATRETRQNFRAAMYKARKQAAAEAREAKIRARRK